MQYKRLGDTGLIVSRMALGVMTFGTPAGPHAALQAAIAKVNSEDLAQEIVSRALDAGINHFNTANVYTGGDSEQMLGKALGCLLYTSPSPRDGLLSRMPSSA